MLIFFFVVLETGELEFMSALLSLLSLLCLLPLKTKHDFFFQKNHLYYIQINHVYSYFFINKKPKHNQKNSIERKRREKDGKRRREKKERD